MAFESSMKIINFKLLINIPMENKQNSGSQPQSNLGQSAQNNTQRNQSVTNQSYSGQSSQSSRSQSNQPSSSTSGSSSSGSINQQRNSSSSSESSWKDNLKVNDVTNKLQEFGNTAMNKVNSLSTTQKVVGGSLLALGAGWLAMNSRKSGKTKSNLNTTKSKKFGRS
jgi:hypothetical protein